MAIKFILKQHSLNGQTNDDSILGEYLFDGGIFTIGSDPANNLVLDKGALEQAVVIPEADNLMLINRAEGMQVNGENLRREAFHPLAAGDKIIIENYVIFVTDDENDFSIQEPAPETSIANINDDETENIHSENLPKPSSAEPSPKRNFADVLNTLRTEEDSFYFTVENGTENSRRILLESDETPIGANGKAGVVFSVEQISTLLAVARKDWSGILIEAKRANAVLVNGEPVPTTRRLRNDDRISFSAAPKFSLVLHEPNSLVELESLLSARVASGGARFGGLAAGRETALEKIKMRLSLNRLLYYPKENFSVTSVFWKW